MTTFLIFIGLIVGFYILKSLFATVSSSNTRRSVFNELEKERPGFKREFQSSQLNANEQVRRQKLYLEYMSKKNYELGFDWKENCSDDVRWRAIEPQIKRFLNE